MRWPDVSPSMVLASRATRVSGRLDSSIQRTHSLRCVNDKVSKNVLADGPFAFFAAATDCTGGAVRARLVTRLSIGCKKLTYAPTRSWMCSSAGVAGNARRSLADQPADDAQMGVFDLRALPLAPSEQSAHPTVPVTRAAYGASVGNSRGIRTPIRSASWTSSTPDVERRRICVRSSTRRSRY